MARILHISTRLILGGSQENTVLSCEGQARLGHDVHLAFGPIFGPEGSLLARVSNFRGADGRGITPHEAPHLVREIDPRADWLCYRELRALISELKPDVVHTHSSKAGVLGRAAAWAAGGKLGRPLVVHTIHGPPFHRYEKPWRNRLYVAMEKFAARRCHRIVSVADAMTKQFLEAGIGRPEQFVTVRSGMETEPYLNAAPGESREEIRARLGLAGSDVVIGTVARLAELKGHDDIIDALEADLRARPELKLLWVGDGWWTKRLTERLLRLDLRAKVAMAGLVPPESIPGMIRAMDLVVHPSYREGLPRVVPQALLAGVPVVAYDVDGTSEVCIDAMCDAARGTGRLVSPGDVGGLREAVLWMLADPSRARALAERGREACRETFSVGAMIQSLERIYFGLRESGNGR